MILVEEGIFYPLFSSFKNFFFIIFYFYSVHKHIHVYMTCLLRNLYAGQEATVRTGHGTTNWFQIGKGVRQAVYCLLI